MQNSKKVYAGMSPSVSAQVQQKNQMFQDIQSLASALIKAEKKTQRQKLDQRQHVQKLKSIIEDQEQCMQLMQEKMQRLVQKNGKVERLEQKERR